MIFLCGNGKIVIRGMDGYYSGSGKRLSLPYILLLFPNTNAKIR